MNREAVDAQQRIRHYRGEAARAIYNIPEDVAEWLRDLRERAAETVSSRKWTRLVDLLVQMGIETWSWDETFEEDAVDRWLRINAERYKGEIRDILNEELGDVPGARKAILGVMYRELSFEWSEEEIKKDPSISEYGTIVHKDYGREVLMPFLKTCLRREG